MLSSICLLSLMINITLSPLRCIVSSSCHCSPALLFAFHLCFSLPHSFPLWIQCSFCYCDSVSSRVSLFFFSLLLTSNGETARCGVAAFAMINRLINYYYYFVYACNHHYTWVCAFVLPLLDYPLPLRISRRA